jgi:hypothetical protein
MSTTKLSEKENLTTYACWLARGRPNDNENQGKCIKSTVLGKLPL